MNKDLILSLKDSILIISPHPDDETLSSGGIIQKAIKLKIPIKILIMTNGENFKLTFKLDSPLRKPTKNNINEFGKKRQNEAIAALHILGVNKKDITFLSLPDKGIKSIYLANTNIEMLQNFIPTKIFYPSDIDKHPDHRFTSLIVKKVFANNLNTERYAYLLHYKWWPMFQNLKRKNYISPPLALLKNKTWVNVTLSKDEEAIKKKALMQYVTQRRLIFLYFNSIAKNNELFIKE